MDSSDDEKDGESDGDIHGGTPPTYNSVSNESLFNSQGGEEEEENLSLDLEDFYGT